MPFQLPAVCRVWLADLLPVACPLCAMPDPAGRARLCAWCLAALPGRLSHRCPRCALPRPQAGTCPSCRREPSPIDATIALADYGPPLDQAIKAFKYRQRPSLAGPLADALVDAIRAREPLPCWPTVIVPMPLTDARLRERGFNQASRLARALGKALDLPVLPSALSRSGEPVLAHQAGRSRQARRSADLGRFDGSAALRGCRVALVDDVMTTGATLQAAARAVRAAGANRVDAWVLARTIDRPRVGG
ncbi:MAG: ComF family protein [Burkholderiaceae bacterium]